MSSSTNLGIMKKAIQLKTGDPRDASIISFSSNSEKPVVNKKSSNVLIKVKSVSINPVDYKIANGTAPINAFKSFPLGVGSDASGVVEAVGDACTKFKVGDEVYGDFLGYEAIAEYVAVPEYLVASKPKNLSFDEAATVPLASQTALQGLRDKGRMKSGMKVAIFGGSGGVGCAAIQIAKALGASYIATTSTHSEYCKSLGADEVINYRNEDIGEKLRGQNFDIVYDTVGGYDYWVAAKKMLAPEGRFVTITGDTDAPMWQVLPKSIYRMIAGIGGCGFSYTIFLTDNKGADCDVLTEMIESGKLKAIIDGEILPFNQDGINELYKRIMGGRTKGKIVLRVAD